MRGHLAEHGDYRRNCRYTGGMYQWLLRGWAANIVQNKVRSEVLRAAKQHLAAASAEAAGTAQGDTCDVGVVFALPEEAGGFEDRLEDLTSIKGCGFVVRKGLWRGRQVVVVHSGAGRTAAANATAALIAGHRPRWVISAGFAGGLDPAVRRHDLLVADALVDVAGATQQLELPLPRDWFATEKRLHLGRLLTGDRVVRLPEDKRTLGRTHQALAVDMETCAVAEVCRDRHSPFLAVRVITDAVDDTLPPDLEHLLRQKSTAGRWGAALGTLIGRPESIKDLYQLQQNALQATDRLAEFLGRVIERAIEPQRREDAEKT
jgi:adenosylhomocysteine nucleosidase